jgi:hypothetical protein
MPKSDFPYDPAVWALEFERKLVEISVEPVNYEWKDSYPILIIVTITP